MRNAILLNVSTSLPLWPKDLGLELRKTPMKYLAPESVVVRPLVAPDLNAVVDSVGDVHERSAVSGGAIRVLEEAVANSLIAEETDVRHSAAALQRVDAGVVVGCVNDNQVTLGVEGRATR